jgi:outer membrane protein TolC
MGAGIAAGLLAAGERPTVADVRAGASFHFSGEQATHGVSPQPVSSGAPLRLGLRQAMELAEKQNPDIQAARLRELEQAAVARGTRSAYLPQLAANVSGTRQTTNLQGIGVPGREIGIPSRLGPFRTFDARPVLTQTVLDLSLLAQIRAARARVLEAGREAIVTQEATLIAVLQLYLQTFQAESRWKAATARRTTAESALKQARDFREAQTASELDLVRAIQQLEAENVAVAETRRDRDTLKTLLLRTIGLPQDQLVELEEPPLPHQAAPDVEGAVRLALAERPEVLALESRIQATENEVESARWERLPKLGFRSDYGVLGAGPDRSVSTYYVGGTLSVPIWTSGRIESEIAGARARADRARQELRATQLRVSQEVRQSRIEMDAALEALRAAETGTSAARKALELSQLRFASGIATNLDLITAQGILAEAEDREIRLRYEHALARARLARARGSVYSFFE